MTLSEARKMVKEKYGEPRLRHDSKAVSMKYYLKYRLISGLGGREFEEWFGTIGERYARYQLVTGAGYEITEFGTTN